MKTDEESILSLLENPRGQKKLADIVLESLEALQLRSHSWGDSLGCSRQLEMWRSIGARRSVLTALTGDYPEDVARRLARHPQAMNRGGVGGPAGYLGHSPKPTYGVW